jgi:hypothetical protein
MEWVPKPFWAFRRKETFLAPAEERPLFRHVQNVISSNSVIFFIYICSKTCLKRNLTEPENFSAKACFRLIEVYCLKRNLKLPEHFSAKARLN